MQYAPSGKANRWAVRKSRNETMMRNEQTASDMKSI